MLSASTAVQSPSNSIHIEDFYYTALQNSAAGVMIVGPSGEILHVNPAVRELLGAEFGLTIGAPLYSCFAKDGTFDRIVDVVLGSLSAPDEVYSETVRFWRDSTILFLSLKISKFRLESGKLAGVVVVINDTTHQQLRLAFGSLFASISAVVFGYISLISFFAQLRGESQSVALVLLMLVPFFGSVFILARSGLPIELLGVTVRKWRVHAREAMALSLVGCMLLTLTLAAAQLVSPQFAAIPIFNVGSLLAPATAVGFLVYVAMAPVQEFVTRGALQGPLEQIFGGKTAPWKANVAVNLMFSVFHQHIGMGFAIMVLVPGLFWGWLYSRQRSLVGVSLSHAVIGTYALGVINTPSFIEAALG